MSAEVARVLREAAELIEPPGRWTTGTLARDEHGHECQPESNVAVCWCAMGALFRVGPTAAGVAARRLFARTVSSYRLGMWNDAQPGPEPVVAALRAAADKAEAS